MRLRFPDFSTFFNCADQADVCLELRSYVEAGADDADHSLTLDLPAKPDEPKSQQPEDLHVPSSPRHVVHSQSTATASALKGNGSTRLMLHGLLLSAGSPYFKACLSEAWVKPQSADGRTLLIEYVEEEEVEAAKEVLRFLYTGSLRCGAAGGTNMGTTCLLLLRMARLAARFQTQHCLEQCLEALQQLPGSCWGLPAISLLFGLPEATLQGGPSETTIRSTALSRLLQIFTPQPWVLGAEERRQFCSLPRAAVVAWVSGISQTTAGAGARDLKDDGEAHVLELVSAWAAGHQGSSKDLLPKLMAGMKQAKGGEGAGTQGAPAKTSGPGWSGPSWSRSLYLLQLDAKLRATAAFSTLFRAISTLVAWLRHNPEAAAQRALPVVMLLILRGEVCSLLPGFHVPASAAASSLVCSPGAGPLLLYTALAPTLLFTAVTALVAAAPLATALLDMAFMLFVCLVLALVMAWMWSLVVLVPTTLACQLLRFEVDSSIWRWGAEVIGILVDWLFIALCPYN